MKIRRGAVGARFPSWLMICRAFADDPVGEDTIEGAGGEEAPGDDLRADIVAAMDEQGGGEEGEAGAPAQPRKPDGKFDKKPAEAPAAAAKPARQPGEQPKPAAAAEAPKPAAAPQSPPPPPAQGKMPDNWLPRWMKPVEGFDLAALPAGLRQQWYAREQAFSRTYNDMDGRVKAWSPIEEKLAPLAAAMQERGSNVQQFVGNLLQVEDWLHKDSGEDAPALAPLDWLAQQYYGVSLEELVAQRTKTPPPANRQQPSAPDPMVKRLADEVENLKRGQTEREAAEQNARKAALRNDYLSFERKITTQHPEAAVTNAQGSPELDPAVRQTMRALLASGEANTFEEAFEKARWLHPTLRERTLQAQRKSQAERARTAAVTPRRTSPIDGGARGSSGNSVDDDVRATLAELNT